MLPDELFIPDLLEPFNNLDDFLIPGAMDSLYESLLLDSSPLFGSELDGLLTEPWPSSSNEDSLAEFDQNSVLLRDCMWTSNTARQETVQIRPEPLSEACILGLPMEPLAPCSSKETGYYYVRNCAPYTINNDHCYFMHREQRAPDSDTDQDVKVKQEPKDSETSDSETSGDEVDIETVRENKHGLCSIKLQRTLQSNNNAWSCRRPNPPAKSRNSKSVRLDTAAVKARLVQAKQMQMSGKCIARTNRRRRPANSLNTSSGNSTDTEEPVRRTIHNSMERLRRQQQRSALYLLREQIPDLRNDTKAPKVKILEFGTDYIKKIDRLSAILVERKRRLLEKRRELQKRLDYLRRRR